MRKKRGSSLLLVLGITFILITVGGIVTTSVMHTTGQHNNVKVESDLTYAAESGIENAFSKIKEKKIQLNPGETNPPYNINSFFVNENIKVKIEISRDIDKYNVISTAKKGDKETKVKSSIKVDTRVDGNNSIFKYVICTKKAILESTGPLHGAVSLWNVTDVDGSKFVEEIKDDNNNKLPDENEGNEMQVNIENGDFLKPKFKFESRDSLKISSVDELDSYAYVDKENETPADELLKKGVRKIKFGELSIYMINFENESDYLEIETGVFLMLNKVILTNGKVRISNVNNNIESTPNVVLNSSTIFANEVDMRIASFDSIYRIIGNTSDAFDKLNTTTLEQLNNELGNYINNWNDTIGTVTEDVIIGDVEYIE